MVNALCWASTCNTRCPYGCVYIYIYKFFMLHAYSSVSIHIYSPTTPYLQSCNPFHPSPSSAVQATQCFHWSHIHSNLGSLLLPHKVDDMVHCLKLYPLGRFLLSLFYETTSERGCNAASFHFWLGVAHWAVHLLTKFRLYLAPFTGHLGIFWFLALLLISLIGFYQYHYTFKKST